jgi:hypothetical protein
VAPEACWLTGGFVGCDSGAEPAVDGDLEPRPRRVEPGPDAEPRDAGPPREAAGGRDELSEMLSLGLPPRPLLRAAPLMASRCFSDFV